MVLWVLRRPEHPFLPKELGARAAPVLARQYGLITRSHAQSLGFTRDAIRHRTATGIWVRLLPGVYRLGAVPQSWKQRLLAACLWSGTGVASHRSAAALFCLDGFGPGIVEITSGVNAPPAPTGIVLHRSGRLASDDRTRLYGIPVTTVSRTLVDLGAVAPKLKVQFALDHALRDELVGLEALQAALERSGGRGRRGAGTLRKLVSDPDIHLPVPASVLERRVINRLKDWGIPDPIRQWEVFDDEGCIGAIDFAWPEQRLGLEADGWAHLSKRHDWRHDRIRRNRLTKLGLLVLHGTWEDTRKPERLLAQIRSFFV
jgi:hypothetical protein